MSDQIKLKIDDGKEIIVKKDIIVSDLIKILGTSSDIIAASIDGEIVELSHKITEDAEINFIKISDKVGGKIYRAGLQFVYIVAIKELFGEKVVVRIKHSLDKAIYTTVNGKITKEDVIKIKKKMKEIIDLDINIQKTAIPKKKAIEYFKKNGELEKIDLYNQISNDYVIFYELLGYYNYFYYFLPTSTSILNKFDLKYISPNGVVLMYPKGKDNLIPPYNHYIKVLNVFKDYEDKMKKVGVSYASDINKLASIGKITEFIKINEMMQEEEITNIIKTTISKKSVKMILIGGPSCSGKTTVSKKIALKLKEYGKNPFTISLDDYYKNRNETPKDESGNYDFESLDAIDIKLFNKQLKDLLNYKEVKMPTFNFLTGEKEYKTNALKLEKDSIIIVEGLHTLNEELTKSISKTNKFKIYVSPFTPLGMDRHNHISTTDLRLIRRIVRDNRSRGYNVDETIKRWKLMRNSEEKYVFPYQNEADALYNSALMYEINALRTYVEPLLYSIGPENENYEEALRLIKFIKNFFCIPDDGIPEMSVLREFLGKSYFE